MSATHDSRRMQLTVAVLTFAYRPSVRRAARQVLQGRLFDPDRPENGRWLRHDVDLYLAKVWRRAADLIPLADLESLPTYGNRHNVFLAVVTTSAYQILVEGGTARRYATVLTADVGWKIYARMLGGVAAASRIFFRDPARRVEGALRALMMFPFSAPGAPGYEVRAWSEGGAFMTHWTHCPPHAFVRRVVEQGSACGELEAFYRSWCLYDWPGADLLAGAGTGHHYSRPHTMSRGDLVCDMCWRGAARSEVSRSRPGGTSS